MKYQLLAAAVAAALSVGSAAQAKSPDDEFAQIRSQLQTLMQRVDKLEAENSALKVENDQLKLQTEQVSQQLTRAADAPPPAVKAADWPSRIMLKGDVRYRHSQTEDERVSGTREQEILRARLSLEGKVNDRMVAGVGVTTSAAPGSPRGGNVTLDDTFSRKSLYLELAYFDWTVAGDTHLIGGKMKMPFERPGQSLFWDNDITPEGLAVTYGAGSMFGSAWSYWIDENVQTGSGASSNSDAKMYGLQVGNRFDIHGDKLTIAASYYDLAAAQGRRPFYGGNANGNSLSSTGGLAYDFQVVGLMAEYNTQLGGMPLQVWGDFAKNLDAEYDTAFSMGTMIGKASAAGSWETGLAYQLLEKDALFAQFIDADFGGGLADAEGWVLRSGYAPLKNFVLGATYFKNVGNRNVGSEYDFDRLMIDFNTKF